MLTTSQLDLSIKKHFFIIEQEERSGSENPTSLQFSATFFGSEVQQVELNNKVVSKFDLVRSTASSEDPSNDGSGEPVRKIQSLSSEALSTRDDEDEDSIKVLSKRRAL